MLVLMPKSLKIAALALIILTFALVAISLPPNALIGFFIFAPAELSAYILAFKKRVAMGLSVLTLAAVLEVYVIFSHYKFPPS